MLDKMAHMSRLQTPNPLRSVHCLGREVEWHLRWDWWGCMQDWSVNTVNARKERLKLAGVGAVYSEQSARSFSSKSFEGKTKQDAADQTA